MALLQRTRFYFKFLNVTDISDDTFVVENSNNSPTDEIRRILIDNTVLYDAHEVDELTFSLLKPQDADLNLSIPKNNALILPVSKLNSFYAFETSPGRPYYVYVHDGPIPDYLSSFIAQTIQEFLKHDSGSVVDDVPDVPDDDIEDSEIEDVLNEVGLPEVQYEPEKEMSDQEVEEYLEQLSDDDDDDTPNNDDENLIQDPYIQQVLNEECCRCKRLRPRVQNGARSYEIEFKCGDPDMDYSKIPAAQNIYGVLKVIREQLKEQNLEETQIQQLKQLETKLCSQICALEHPDVATSNEHLTQILNSGSESPEEQPEPEISAAQSLRRRRRQRRRGPRQDQNQEQDQGPDQNREQAQDQGSDQNQAQSLQRRKRRRPKKRQKYERSRRAILNSILKKEQYKYGAHLKKLTKLVQEKEDDPTITIPAVGNKLSTTKYSFFEIRDGTSEIPSLASPFVNLGRGYYIHRVHVTPEQFRNIINHQKEREEKLVIWSDERKQQLEKRLKNVIRQNRYRKWIPKAFIRLADGKTLDPLNIDDEIENKLVTLYEDQIQKLRDKYPHRSSSNMKNRIKKQARKAKFF